MTKYLPAGCKDANLNLTGAYRTTYTRLEVGDQVRIQRSLYRASFDPSPTKAPSKSFWATVTKVERGTGWISVEVESEWFTGALSWNIAHTAITRKERAQETACRLGQEHTARRDALQAAEVEQTFAELADAPAPVAVPQIPFMCGSHAHRTQAERTECQATAARLTAHTVPLADPADLAADLVRIGRQYEHVLSVAHALNVVGQLLDAASDADRAYYRLVYAELVSLRTRAVRVASDAAMRQVADPEPERAVLGEPMCLGDFGAYGSCIAVPGHPGKCMDAFGHRFDGRNRAAAAVDVDRALDSAFPAVASPDRTKLLNAEGTIRNLIMEAKDFLAVPGDRTADGELADAQMRARLHALEEVLELLV